MKDKKLEPWEVKIEAENRKEADELRDALVDVIMQNGRLSAEIASRWLKAHGYYMVEKAYWDARVAPMHGKPPKARKPKRRK